MDERKTIRIYLLIKYWNNLRTQQIIFWWVHNNSSTKKYFVAYGGYSNI
jgi:hypothetical protein